MMTAHIQIRRATENNLKAVSLDIPKNKLVVVTGVSGSGKSSLIYDVIFREAESRYLGSFSSYARQFLSKMKRPEVEKIEGLSPAISVDQKSVVRNPRSTVGTMTGIYDYLRLIYARLGKSSHPDTDINRSLFSFNAPQGACPNCNGLGVEDRLDPELIIADPNKTLREGALVITTPSGYIIYSQVTMDVLDEVCRSEGFNVDIPWKDLTPGQKHVVLYGSDKIEIPYGKHTLESRMKWSGITAKPRETGYYKGILPVMENILKRDRNKNILRFVRTVECSVCHGQRLNEQALSVKWHGHNIAELAAMSLEELHDFLKHLRPDPAEVEILKPLSAEIIRRIGLLIELGAGYLSCSRESTSLSGGEAQRLRLATQVTSGLKGVLYIFDEPSIGLHPSENQKMIAVLKRLRNAGNTVLVVEHEDDFIRAADHLIDIGPKAGGAGGRVLINAPVGELKNLPSTVESRTLNFLSGREGFSLKEKPAGSAEWLSVKGAAEFNLQHIDVDFRLSAINVVTGVSGAGKSTLTNRILARSLQKQLHQASATPGAFGAITGWEKIKKVVAIDQSPIGRTPRSNPATYTKLADHIRDVFAALPESKARGWKKGRFSFNVAGGRCETCQGAGYRQVGMHFMGDVEIVCETCHGKRFNHETLQVKYHGKNIYEVLEMPVEEAVQFFAGQPKILRIVSTLDALGLGYLRLGQRSTTLSGGEAQRVKLAAELARPGSAHTLYILDEPTTGLHNADVKILLGSLQKLAAQKHTIIVIEHHLGMIASADHVVDLGPGSGKYGGRLVASGTPKEVIDKPESLTGKALRDYLHHDHKETSEIHPSGENTGQPHLQFSGVTTHNLQHVNVDFPQNKITVLTGVSGSGKSSLAFDTVYAEGRNRFLESYSPYIRSRIGMQARADFDEVRGLTPTMAISRQGIMTGPRSTVGTMTGIYDLYRLMYARIAEGPSVNGQPLSSLFSFNHQHGACPQCDGLGTITVTDPDKLVTDPDKPLIAGAIDGTKTGKFYGDPYGQYVHTLLAAGKRFGVDFSIPWNQLGENEKSLAMYGSGDESYNVTWKYKRGKREGEHRFQGQWPGFARLVEQEYARKHADRRGESMLPLMKEQLCPSCHGARLNETALQFTVVGLNIAGLSHLSVRESLHHFKDFEAKLNAEAPLAITRQLRGDILRKLEYLDRLGLGYLRIDRESGTLSGGEAQRVRLAAQLGNGLTGMTFVLDEPTVGLHPADTASLIDRISELRDAGNTVLVVEHDRRVMLAADRLIELGPGAGSFGGRIISSGSAGDLMADPVSATGKYLSRADQPVIPEHVNTEKHSGQTIQIRGAFAHNLNNINPGIPLGKMVLLTGVSGSGKSTLVFDVIARSWELKSPGGCRSISGLEHVDQVVAVTQQPVSTSQVSNAATFTGLFDRIRDLFAKTTDAQSRKLKKSHFSFNTRGGRCEKCQGRGRIRISLDFVSDVWVTCDECHGRRYREEVLECRLHGKNIFEVLEMSIHDAAAFFDFDQMLKKGMQTLDEVGLGYLRLGQSTNTLSGGELQRLKLARELMKSTQGKNLYLFDEPSTGLHFKDVEMLLKLFGKLTAQGHSLLIIEHDPDIIRRADWVIDLGPGGGDEGGEIVATGTPNEIARNENSLTGRFLGRD